MTQSRKAKPRQGPKVPRFTQFRCKGTTPDGIEVTSAAMKVRLYRNGVVVLFKGRAPGGHKGAFSGIFMSVEELAALELAARQARVELLKSPPKVKKGAFMPETTSPDEVLTFRLGTDEYGIDILRVQEIRSYESPTRIADAPAWWKGVINLRGVIVPIVDLRIRIGGEVRYDTFTVVVVLNVKGRIIGVVVDSVSDVLEFSPDQVRAVRSEPNPDRLTYVTGVVTTVDHQILIMDIEGFLCDPGMNLISPA